MSWLERAFESGSKEAERLPNGELRTLAFEGLEAFGEEEVVEVLERRGEDAFRSLAAGLIGGEEEEGFRVFAPTKPGIEGVFEALDDAHAQDVEAFDLEAKARKDRGVILRAVTSAGLGAARVGLSYLAAGVIAGASK